MMCRKHQLTQKCKQYLNKTMITRWVNNVYYYEMMHSGSLSESHNNLQTELPITFKTPNFIAFKSSHRPLN